MSCEEHVMFLLLYCSLHFWVFVENVWQKTQQNQPVLLTFIRAYCLSWYVDLWILEKLWSMICSIWNRETKLIRDLLLTFFPSCFGCDKSNIGNHPSYTVLHILSKPGGDQIAFTAYISFCDSSLTLIHFILYRAEFCPSSVIRSFGMFWHMHIDMCCCNSMQHAAFCSSLSIALPFQESHVIGIRQNIVFYLTFRILPCHLWFGR